MRFSGKIRKINHIVFSDPSYKNDMSYRYENKNLNEKDLLVNLDINTYETDIADYKFKETEFILLIKKNRFDSEIDSEGNLRHLKDIKVKEYKIGVDTACVALGINDNAKEIINTRDEWQPSCAIKTGEDGILGNVYEGMKEEKFRFILISGVIDNDMCSETELFDYLKEQFEIVDLAKQDEELLEDERKLKKGDKIEISSCYITNDVGGSTMIRNSKIKSKVDGMKVIVKNPDGTIEHTMLKDNDEIVNLPIEIEIIDWFYSYEKGYRYKGKINNEELIKEFKKIGTTGFEANDYKKYNNEALYEEVLQANKNFDPSIVYFSEFDIIKILERNSNKEVEM